MRAVVATPLRALRDRLTAFVEGGQPIQLDAARPPEPMCPPHPENELVDFARMGADRAKVCRLCGEEI